MMTIAILTVSGALWVATPTASYRHPYSASQTQTALVKPAPTLHRTSSLNGRGQVMRATPSAVATAQAAPSPSPRRFAALGR
ncbi:MAG: hypothetical protein ABSB49_18190 [Polyangia bacterium]|jgi:hypothetical protein